MPPTTNIARAVLATWFGLLLVALPRGASGQDCPPWNGLRHQDTSQLNVPLGETDAISSADPVHAGHQAPLPPLQTQPRGYLAQPVAYTTTTLPPIASAPANRYPGGLGQPPGAEGPADGQNASPVPMKTMPTETVPVETVSSEVDPQTPAAGESGASTAIPLPPPVKRSAIPLKPSADGDSGSSRDVGGLSSVLTMGISLSVVLGVFFIVAWLMRRVAPGASSALPGEVVEVLGQAPLASRQQVHLLRCGKKLLLVSISTAGTETLTEITDPEEVDRLAGLCRQTHAQSATETFRHVFGQFTGTASRAELADSGVSDDVDPPARDPRSLDDPELGIGILRGHHA